MSTQSPPPLAYQLAFNAIPSLQPTAWYKLLQHFPTAAEAWSASSRQLAQYLSPEQVERIVTGRRTIQPERELRVMEQLGLAACTLADAAYPNLLRQIPSPPPLLYTRGQIDWNDGLAVAVVGTRKASAYGLRVAQDIASVLAAAGCIVVSGLALGIDGAAARSALQAGGRTAAVLGCGLGQIYPASHYRLGQQIIAGGGQLLSEFCPYMPPLRHHFPRRNRIIAGLCRATVVVEAAEKSGALITAAHALEQNRDVASVPGSMYNPTATGSNRLLAAGAQLLTRPEDILEILQIQTPETAPLSVVELSDQQAELLALIGQEPIAVDKLATSSRLDISILQATISELELLGVITRDPLNRYHQTRRNK